MMRFSSDSSFRTLGDIGLKCGIAYVPTEGFIDPVLEFQLAH